MLTSLRDGLKTALKSRDQVAVAALRSALAAIDNAEAIPVDHSTGSAGGNEHVAGTVSGLGASEAERRRLTEDDVRSIVAGEVRERLAAAGRYERAGRDEHAERLRSEAGVLSQYLDAAS